MFIILIDNDVLIKTKLKTSFNYKGINIKKNNDEYIFELAYPYDLNDDFKVKEKRYVIENYESTNKIYIYVYKNDEGMNNFNIYPNRDLSIGENKAGTIINTDKYLSGKYLIIKDGIIQTNFNNVFLNNKRYLGETLKHEDVIDYLGTRIYYYKNFLYINNFHLQFNIKPARLKENIYHLKSEQIKIDNYFKRNHSDIVLKKLIQFNPPRKLNNKKLVYQIGPSITMSLAMSSIAAINIYNSYNNNGFSLSLIAFGLMPITIMLSGIFWPLLNRKHENKIYKKEYDKTKQNYLKYLKEYENDCLEEISRFIKDENYYAFNVDNVINKLFYITKSSSAYLSIDIGRYTRKIEFKYDRTIDEEINEELLNLSYKISLISNLPLFIDLKKDKKVSIITNNKRYYLLRILLELAYKYSPEDLCIVLYTKDKEVYELVYNLIHLFDGRSRYIFDSTSDLNKLKSINKLKNIVLLTDETFEIEDEEIIIIRITDNAKNILKYSDVVVEDFGNTSYFNGKKQLVFGTYKEEIDFKKYFEILSKLENNNLNIKISRFKDYYDIDNINNAYKNHDNSLKSSFGFDSDNKLVEFDIHESKDGPHGLIGGSTGSGKSELIISFLLSLVLRYPPDYINIILIDFKGGGVKESLTSENKVIPHVIASVNNLEEGAFERLIVAIDFELKRRQRLFKDLSNKSSNSIMSIDDYLSTYKDYGFNPLAHLLILVDEFAELKKENPEVIKELISFSRIGRSLGLHLILATQKPSGIIDDEIWSNSRFKIALKVHNEKDSEDIIKSKDAYYLKRPGEFYLKVDETLRHCFAIYSKTDVNNEDKYEVSVLDKNLNNDYQKTIRNKNPIYESTYICSKIIETSNNLNIKVNEFEYQKPIQRDIDDLVTKDKLVFGIKDDYLNAKRGVLSYSLSDNIFIYSNRKEEINNIIYQLNIHNRKMVLISDKKISVENICDVIEYDDRENLYYLFNKLLDKKLCDITVLIDDINTLISYDENYGDYLLKLSKRKNVSLYNVVVLSSISSINFKILNNFKYKLAIEINDKQDLTNIYSIKGDYLGKSYYFEDTPITFVPCFIKSLQNTKQAVSSFLDPIPTLIYPQTVNEQVLIGYYLDTRSKVYIKLDETILITSFNKELLDKAKKLYTYKNVEVLLYEDSLVLKKYKNIIWLGDGLYSQRLFYPDRNIELKDNGYLYRNGRGRGIALINSWILWFYIFISFQKMKA